MIQNFFQKLADKEKKLFCAAMLIIVLSLFDLLFLRPVLSNLETVEEDIHDKVNSINKDMRFLAYQAKIKKEQATYRHFNSEEEKTEEEVIADFLKSVETIASESNIVLSKLSPSEVVQKKGYTQYHANLEAAGPLQNVITFMHKIDSTEDLLRIMKYSLIGKKGSPEDVAATMKISKLILDVDADDASAFDTGEDEKFEDAQGNQIGDPANPNQQNEENSAAPEISKTQTDENGKEKDQSKEGDTVAGDAGQKQKEGDASDEKKGSEAAPAGKGQEQKPGAKGEQGKPDDGKKGKGLDLGGDGKKVDTGKETIGSLWEQWFGKKKKKEEKPPEVTQKKKSNEKPEDEKPNLWERLLSPDAKKKDK